MINITFFQRKPYNIHYSIEMLFEAIKCYLKDSVQTNVWVSPWYSNGFIDRVLMIINAKKHATQINHITGDIHFIALGLRKKNTILTIHDIGFLKEQKNPIKKWLFKKIWITLPIMCADVVTVVSEATKRDLQQYIKTSTKIKVIGNFISENFKQSNKIFNCEKPQLLQIGSTPNKNLERVIEAIKEINCKLNIIGYPTVKQIHMLEENNIDFCIYSGLSESELIDQYINCDILVFVSLNEGFGLPILEAQVVGRAVITSNISSMPEVAGNGAHFVDPYNINDIKNAIRYVINNSEYREIIINNGYNNSSKYSLKNIADQYYSIYKEMARKTCVE